MSQEFEPRRLRQGEGKNRPIGGHIADAPFAKALRALAVDKGFESQSALSRALGKSGNSNVRGWYCDIVIPSPEGFGNLLILFQTIKPYDDKMEALVSAYAQEISKGRGTQHGKNSSERVRNNIKPLGTPMSQWTENFCSKRNITLSRWFRALGLPLEKTSQRARFDLNSLSHILQNAPEAFDLSQEETERLSEAVVLEIQQRLEKGKRFQDSPSGHKIKKMQENLPCRTYNGVQAAIELDITRERVRQLRQELGWEFPLLTEDQMEVFKKKVETAKASREKQRDAKMRNRSYEISLSQ